MASSRGADETEIPLSITMMSRVGKSTTTQHILLSKFDPSSKAHSGVSPKSPAGAGKGKGSAEAVAGFLARRVAAEEGDGTSKELEDRECVEKIQREMQMIERKGRIARMPLYSRLQMAAGNKGVKEAQLRKMVQDIESKEW